MNPYGSAVLHLRGAVVVLLVLAGAKHAPAQAMPEYTPGPPLHGVLTAAGAEAMGPLMQRLGERLMAVHPGVRVQVDAGGPPRAPAGLADGTAQIGFTGRTYRPAEVTAIERAHGRPPLQFLVGAGAYDNKAITQTMAVLVHEKNPLTSLTLGQVKELFSGEQEPSWSALGLPKKWAARPVNVYAGKFGTGAAEFVRETVLGGADWHPRVREFATDEAAVETLLADENGLALVGLGFLEPGTRVLALAAGETEPAYRPTRAHVESRCYPLARLLYFHVVAPPSGEPLDPLVSEFLRLILSREGQQEVAAAGYLPLQAGMIEVERQKLASR